MIPRNARSVFLLLLLLAPSALSFAPLSRATIAIHSPPLLDRPSTNNSPQAIPSHSLNDMEEEEEDSSQTIRLSDKDWTVKEHARWCRAVEQTVSKLQNKERALETELERVRHVDALKTRAHLLASHLYLFQDGVTNTATVVDWETNAEVTLTLNTAYDSAADEVKGLYQKLKKYQRGSQAIVKQLELARANLDTMQQLQSRLQRCRVEDDDTIDTDLFRLVQEQLSQTSQSTRFVVPQPNPLSRQEGTVASVPTTGATSSRDSSSKRPALGTPASNVRKLISPSGCTVLVGRNQRGNEYLSCTYGKPDDLWMHARQIAGAHVLLLQRRGSAPAQDVDIQFALNLAAFYSDARTEEKVSVTISSPKHIAKPKRAPLGAVLVRKELQTGIGKPDRVPESLKEQRAKSGRSDDYRQQDKGKLRKRGKKRKQR